MKRILIALMISMSLTAVAQSGPSVAHKYDVSTDAKNGSLIFKGQLTLDDLAKEPSFGWYRNGLSSYTPDKEAITYLKYYLPKYQLIVFLGTWCEDSHNVIPKMAKVLQEANAMDGLTMYGVDRDKWSGDGESKKYGVTKVPTIIVMQGDREVGRIKEYPNESVETDLSWMIDKDVKEHSTVKQ